MAAHCAARKALQMASTSARTKFASSCVSSPFAFASKTTKFKGLPFPSPSSSCRSLTPKLSSISRLPKELAGLELSVMPLQSVTASALFTSLLSLHNRNWGCLSEVFATPL